MDDEFPGFLEILFVLCLGWIYRLARFFARVLRKFFIPSGYYPLLIIIILWEHDFIDYGTSGDHGFSFMPFLGEQFLGMWKSGFWRGCGIFMLWGWIHAFVISLALSSWNLERKSKKMRAAKAVMDRGESRDVLGLDLVTGDPIPVSLLDVTFPLQVLGSSGVYARSMLQKALEADVKYGHSVLILASETQKELLREVTYVLRERGSETERAFFYFSLKHPDLSASYSPFHGKGSSDFLRDHLKLDRDGMEAGILDLLVRSLEKNGKPYVPEDLLLLLKDKRAAMALNEIDLTREYLWRFDSLRKASGELAKKLTKWGNTMHLEKYPITQGYPLDISDILNSGKHLLVELESKGTEFMRYFLSRLFCDLTKRMKHSPSANQTVIYLIFPEEFLGEYPIELYLEDLSLEDYRIFSSRFSPLYREKQKWNTVFLPDVSEGVLKSEGYKRFHEGIGEEKNRLWGQWDLKALMNEETVEASCILLREIGGGRVNVGFMTRYDRYRNKHYTDCRFFYAPGKDVEKADYVPYQKRYKPENMLNLCDRAPKIKADILRHDPRVVSIIQDLKPKEPAQP
ncbi:MAG: hypothetical protein V1673_06350 [Candidatus Omnitrophota bacterium]